MIELDSLKRHPDAGGKPGEAVLCDLGARSVIAALPPLTVMMNDSRYGAGLPKHSCRTRLECFILATESQKFR